MPLNINQSCFKCHIYPTSELPAITQSSADQQETEEERKKNNSTPHPGGSAEGSHSETPFADKGFSISAMVKVTLISFTVLYLKAVTFRK